MRHAKGENENRINNRAIDNRAGGPDSYEPESVVRDADGGNDTSAGNPQPAQGL